MELVRFPPVIFLFLSSPVLLDLYRYLSPSSVYIFIHELRLATRELVLLGEGGAADAARYACSWYPDFYLRICCV